jgi:hypothetical protein
LEPVDGPGLTLLGLVVAELPTPLLGVALVAGAVGVVGLVVDMSWEPVELSMGGDPMVAEVLAGVPVAAPLKSIDARWLGEACR